MRLGLILLACLSILLVASGHESEAFLQKTRVALSKQSTWPSDHGDTSRSKVTLDAGLPANFSSEDLKTIQTRELPLTQWIYTGGENSKYVYVIGGLPVKGSFVAKLDAKTLQILQKFPLTPALYVGGLLMHDNGHVYCMHSNKLIVFWNGDLTTYKIMKLPSTLNGDIIQTNGMLVTQDGNIVVKQWDLIFEDVLFLISAKPYAKKILYAMIVVAISIAFGFQVRNNSSKSELKQKSLLSILLTSSVLGSVVGFCVWFATVVGSFYAVVGPFNPFRYFASNILFYGAGGSELKIIDPISFEIKADLYFTERCSFARMAMASVTNELGESEDAIALLGDENVYQARWNVNTKKLSTIPAWTQQYRKRGDGSFPGTGPSIFNNELFFTDNTFPVYLANNTYSLFKSPLLTIAGTPITTADYLSSEETNAQAAVINSGSLLSRIMYKPSPAPWLAGTKISPASNKPGFMFWSTAVSPTENNIVVWDTAGRSVQSRHASDLEVNWEIKNIIQADCVSIAVDKGHIYMSDYDFAPENPNEWLEAISSENDGSDKQPSKYFIVADIATGKILGNLTIAVNEGLQASLIVPGANNDVFIGTKQGLTRIYV